MGELLSTNAVLITVNLGREDKRERIMEITILIIYQQGTLLEILKQSQ